MHIYSNQNKSLHIKTNGEKNAINGIRVDGVNLIPDADKIVDILLCHTTVTEKEGGALYKIDINEGENQVSTLLSGAKIGYESAIDSYKPNRNTSALYYIAQESENLVDTGFVPYWLLAFGGTTTITRYQIKIQNGVFIRKWNTIPGQVGWTQWESYYTKPQTGIPKTDLAAGVQNSLDNADTAMRIAMYDSNIEPSDDDEFSFVHLSGGGYAIWKANDNTGAGENVTVLPYEHLGEPVNLITYISSISPQRLGFTNTQISDVIIPKSITEIEANAFRGTSESPNTRLETVIINEGTTTIGNNCFAYCTNLVKIVIPDSVTTFGENVFFHSSNVVVYCNKDSYAETYCQTNNITYVTNVDSSDLSGSGDVSTVTLSGDSDVTIQPSQHDIEIKTQGTYNSSTNPIATKSYVDDTAETEAGYVRTFYGVYSDITGATNNTTFSQLETAYVYGKTIIIRYSHYDGQVKQYEAYAHLAEIHYENNNISQFDFVANIGSEVIRLECPKPLNDAQTVWTVNEEIIAKEYELIQKYITGYSLLTGTMPTYAADTYYENTGTVKEPVYTLLTSGTAPEDWEDTPNTKYYEQVATASQAKYYNADLAGTSFDFDKMFVKITNKNADSNYKFICSAIWLFKNGQTGYSNTIFKKTSLNIDIDSVWWFEVIKKCGCWDIQCLSAAVYGGAVSTNIQGGSQYIKATSEDYISSFYIDCSDVRPDVEIEVWGVK